MSRLRFGLAAAAACAAFVLTGCAPSAGGIDPVGTWSDTKVTDGPELVLDSDGSLSGTDGCNNLSGSWRLENDDIITFDSVASTQMACPDVDTWLAGLSQATISGSTMTILGGDGAQLGQLTRAD